MRANQARKLHQHNSWSLGAIVLSVGTALSRVLGFAREFAMAALFGTTASTDIWLMASVLPNLIFGAINGALTNVIVPVMAGHHGPATSDERIFVQEMIGTVGVLATLLAVAGELFSPVLLRLLAPGFGTTELMRTVELTRIMVPTILLWAGAGLAMGVLQAKGIYAPTAGAPIIVNIVRISTIVTLGVVDGITGVAWGFLLAVGSQWAYLVPALRAQGFSLRPRLSINHPWTREALRLVPPLLMMTSTGTVGVVVDRILASSLPVGTIAALNYSLLIVQLPIAVLIIPLVLPGFTRMAEEWNAQQLPGFRRALSRGLELATILIMPSVAFLWVERAPIIAMLYQRGAFTANSTQVTAHLVSYWLLALPAFAWGALVGRAAFALKRMAPLVVISGIAVAVNVGADLALVHSMEGAGLALGTSLAAWTSTLLTWGYVERHVLPSKRPMLSMVWSAVTKYGPATIVLAFLTLFVNRVGWGTISGSVVLMMLHATAAGMLLVVGWIGALGVRAQWRQRWAQR